MGGVARGTHSLLIGLIDSLSGHRMPSPNADRNCVEEVVPQADTNSFTYMEPSRNEK